MEGASGIVSYQQAEPTGKEYPLGREMFMHDLLALLEGLKEGGVEEVVIYDEHWDGRNIDLSCLPVYAKAICGKPRYRPDWPGGLDNTFSGLILLGFHSKSGTENALLPHTYEWDIENLILNGVSIGEIGMEAAIAGDFGVPAIMIIGDSSGVGEAEALLPGIMGVTVKDSLAETGALCYPLKLTGEMIRKAAIKALKEKNQIKPYNYGKNATLEIVLRSGSFLDTMKYKYGKEFSQERVMRISAGNAITAWSDYWEKKIACLEILKGKKS